MPSFTPTKVFSDSTEGCNPRRNLGKMQNATQDMKTGGIWSFRLIVRFSICTHTGLGIEIVHGYRAAAASND